jgi:hypothetical protein
MKSRVQTSGRWRKYSSSLSLHVIIVIIGLLCLANASGQTADLTDARSDGSKDQIGSSPFRIVSFLHLDIDDFNADGQAVICHSYTFHTCRLVS